MWFVAFELIKGGALQLMLLIARLVSAGVVDLFPVAVEQLLRVGLNKG